MQTFRKFAFGTIAVSLFLASSAVMSFADIDPPSRVARLKFMSGDVSMQPGGVNDWAAATINRPMTTADRLWTDKDSRAELHLGSAAMRMNSETSLTLTNLSDNTVQLELDQGTLNLHVARLYEHEIYEVDTPNMAFTLLKPGDYRFDVDTQGDVTLVTVWRGKGVATGDGDAVRVDSNHQIRFFGGMSLAHQSYHAPRLDGFDEWCRIRSYREDRSVSVRYVSPDVIGYEDLDEYGAWRVVGSYGGVWFPTQVEVGWAPYRYGHWAWVEPWGWTWIDDASWGFAPFHYGRWVFVTGRWGWVPGPVAVRPCYAPALVAWIGGGSAGVGWFPLGYGEPYIPNYHASRTYFQTVNVSNTRITNITYVTNNYYNVNNVRINNVRYVNQTTATTIVNNDVIINSRRIDHNVFTDHDHDRYDSHDRWVTNGPQVPPSHDSVLAGLRDDHEPPERIMNRRVVMKMPPPERPVPFDTKRADLEDHQGRPLDRDEEDRLRRRMPPGPMDRDDHGRSASASDGRYPAPNQRDENPGYHNGERADNHGNPNRDSNRDDARQNDDSAARKHDPRMSRPTNDGDDNHGQSASDRGNYPAPRQRDENPGVGGDRANSNNGQHNGPDSQGSQGDDRAARWRVPRPPSRDNGNNNGNNPNNGNNNAGNDHGQPTSAGGYSPAPKQRDENPGVGGDRANSNHGQHNGPDSQGSQGDDRAARWRVPRPPGHDNGNGNNYGNGNGNNNAGNDHGQPTSAGGYNHPAPKQRDENPGVADGDRSGNGRGPQRSNPAPDAGLRDDDASNGRQVPHPPSRYDNGNSGNNGNNNAGDNRSQPSSGGSYYPAPKQRDQNPRGNDGERPGTQIDAMRDRRPNPAPERPAPSPAPSSNDRGAGSPSPQQDHTMMRQAQVDHSNDSHPSQPPPRMAQPQRAPESAHAAQPESHPAPSKDSGSNNNSRGASQFQDRGHGKPQDPDPK